MQISSSGSLSPFKFASVFLWHHRLLKFVYSISCWLYGFSFITLKSCCIVSCICILHLFISTFLSYLVSSNILWFLSFHTFQIDSVMNVMYLFVSIWRSFASFLILTVP